MRRDAQRLRRGRLSNPDAEGSIALRAARAATRERLRLELAEDLPVSARREDLLEVLRAAPVVVVAGETGSGKTTQLPKLLLELGLGVRGAIAHTQPRRLAARTVAQRIADEVGSPLGEAVGYAVRFTDKVSDASLVKVMTDGLLLTEIRSDRYLDAYDAIIVDEAHERSLNIDFLLGYLKGLLARRRDLKVVITSATIDVDRFSAFFDGAPVVEVGGRTYPVEVHYQGEPQDLLTGVIDALEEIEARPHQGASDVLAFFSGEREIFEVARGLRRHFGERWEILPLYARLSLAEQRKVFSQGQAKRRVVLATNVAETSITVPNIGFVVDPGMARINRYSYRTKLQRLPIEPISQASAEQRKGRCGRIAPGVCFRLYDENDFLSRPAFSDPEIRRVNLASVVLQMQAFRLGEIQRFPFVDPPDPRAINDALRLLGELKALEHGKLTDTGRVMARMPVDPRLARMLVEGERQGALRELLVITAALSVPDPRERPLAAAGKADAAQEMFQDERSDFLSFLKLWNWVETERDDQTRRRYERALARRFVNVVRVREWREVHRQLRLVCRTLGWRENDAPAEYAAVHASVLSGSLSLIAQHDERGQYLGARNLKLRIFPGSGLAGRTPRWIVAAEIAETARVYGRCVAFVEPAWIERAGKHLLKSSVSEPFWSAKRGEAMAYQTLTLYGLKVAERRRVGLSRHDAALARDLFLRHALVAGETDNQPDFLQHNLLEMAYVHDLEAKGRRRDLMVSDDEVYAFYAERVPETICRASDLARWLRKAPAETVNGLYLTRDALLRLQAAGITDQDFPAELTFGSVVLPVKYRFAPGEADDGVGLTVPVGVLPAVSPEALEWLVPGLFEPLVEAWLRALPKQKRKHLAPLPDKVAELCVSLLKPDRYRSGRLLTALKELLSERYRLQVAEQDWDRSRLPPHLLMHVRIVDGDGGVLREGRDLTMLKSELAADADGAAKAVQPDVVQGLTGYPAEGVEDHLVLGDARAPVMAFPGLVDAGDTVELHCFATRLERDAAHREGLARLALLSLGQTGRYVRREIDKHPELGLHFVALGDAATLKGQLLLNVAWYCFFEGRPLPATSADFNARVQALKGNIVGELEAVTTLFAAIMAARFRCVSRLDTLSSKAYERSVADMRGHLTRLVPVDVLTRTPRRYLALLPRYLEGIERRIEHLAGHVKKDLAGIAVLAPLQERVARLAHAELYDPERAVALEFLLEELRLATFAEALARSRIRDHPLDAAWFGPGWKASAKRVNAALTTEERRLGLV